MVGPHRAVGREPLVDLAYALLTDAVHALLCGWPHVHKAGIAQYAEVLRDRGLRHVERGDDLADGPFALAEQIEDQAPVGLGERFESGGHPSILLYSYMPVKA